MKIFVYFDQQLGAANSKVSSIFPFFKFFTGFCKVLMQKWKNQGEKEHIFVLFQNSGPVDKKMRFCSNIKWKSSNNRGWIKEVGSRAEPRGTLVRARAIASLERTERTWTLFQRPQIIHLFNIIKILKFMWIHVFRLL